MVLHIALYSHQYTTLELLSFQDESHQYHQCWIILYNKIKPVRRRRGGGGGRRGFRPPSF
jgi:hypothetical protein